MTEEERQAFIRDKIAPLFDGMRLSDVGNIIAEMHVDREVNKHLKVSFMPSPDQAKKETV
jgi:hypothetical protein